MSAVSQAEIDELLLQEFLRRREMKKRGDCFLDFILTVRPDFIVEEVHIAIAEQLERIVNKEIDRLQIFVAPRTGKSLMTSVLFPAWYIGKFPDRQIIQIGHSTNLAESFGRETRNLLNDEAYGQMFPQTSLSKDSRSTGSWATTQNGKYLAAGVGTGISGRGFHLCCLDDVLDEQGALSKVEKTTIWELYSSGIYTRRMPGNNAIVNIQTRWAVDDLAGRLLAQAVIDPAADQWEVLSIPAILDKESAERLNKISHNPKYRKYLSCERFPDPITFKEGDSFSPRRWPKAELLRAKGQMTSKTWSALYGQQPYDVAGGILPRDQWRKWKREEPPECEYVMQVYDTAFEPEEQNDFSARTTWGIFKRPEDGKYACILLERLRDRLTFPELRDEAWESYKEYQPDRVFIEKKASGHSLLQELRRKGVPISPVKAKDSKLARAHAASIVLESGCVYYVDRTWAEDVIQECAEFPNSKHDDVCFVAGTLITMADGSQKPIETLRPGEMVMTHEGPRPVLSSFCTGEHEVGTLTYNDTTITGTANHPVWERVSKTYCAISSLSVDSFVSVYKGGSSWRSSVTKTLSSIPWYLMGIAITATRKLLRRR